MHVVRDMGKADDEQLAAIRESATHLIDEYEQFMRRRTGRGPVLVAGGGEAAAGQSRQESSSRRYAGQAAPGEAGELRAFCTWL